MISLGANTDAPHGFRFVRSLVGGDAGLNHRRLAAANTILGKGDLVSVTAAGVVDRAAASDVVITGVSAESKAASSGGTVAVYENPYCIYEAQCDDGTGTLTAEAGLNLNADFVVANASNGISQMEIDEDSGATTATLPLKVIDLYDVVGNSFGEFNRLLVIIQNHIYKSVGVDGI